MGVFSFLTARATRNVIDGSNLNRYLLHMSAMAFGDVPERSKGLIANQFVSGSNPLVAFSEGENPP